MQNKERIKIISRTRVSVENKSQYTALLQKSGLGHSDENTHGRFGTVRHKLLSDKNTTSSQAYMHGTSGTIVSGQNLSGANLSSTQHQQSQLSPNSRDQRSRMSSINDYQEVRDIVESVYTNNTGRSNQVQFTEPDEKIDFEYSNDN